MDAKLTLKLDKFVIEKAKEYAADHDKSLSRMIESFLKSVIDKEPNHSNNEIEISPFVKSMKTGVNIPPDFNYKAVYSDYLSEKHK